ncbi:MAG: DUF3108 domain-containing protein [Candidatus Binatia bacterium]
MPALWIAIAALLLAGGAPAAVSAPHIAAGPRPQSAPQQLEYRIAWNGIPAAGATVAIKPEGTEGRSGYAVEATASTNRFVDLFWSFRGTAKATVLADGLEPLQYVYRRRTRDVQQVTRIDFDPDADLARAVSIKGEQRREIAVEGESIVDPITAIVRAQLSGAKSGDVLRYEVFTGESRYRVQLTIGGPDSIEVPAGRFRALRVVPQVWKIGRDERLDERLRNATIWVSDDPAHTVLRIRSEVMVGAVTLDLVRLDA